jgi:hypothetical protein
LIAPLWVLPYLHPFGGPYDYIPPPCMQSFQNFNQNWKKFKSIEVHLNLIKLGLVQKWIEIWLTLIWPSEIRLKWVQTMLQHLIMINLVYTNPIYHIKISIEIKQNWIKVSMILHQNKIVIYIFNKNILFQNYLIIWLHPFGGLHNLEFGIVQKMFYGMWSYFICTSFDESLSLKFNNYLYKHGFNNHKKSWNVF